MSVGRQRRVSRGWVLCVCLTSVAFAGATDRASLGPEVLRMPVLEQQVERGILTPVPIDLSLPKGVPARRVLVHYRILGSKEWTSLELGRVGKRWSGAIPCLEVGTITGDITYYVRVHDAEGAVVAYSGSRHQPYRVTILHDSRRGGRSAGEGRCPDPADCPPGLPGCPSEEVDQIPCKTDRDCEGGMSCGWDGFCEHDERRYNWLSVELEAGLGLVSTAGACTVESQEREGYLCLRGRDGAVYTGNPLPTNEPLSVGRVPIRALFGYERVIEPRSTLAVRLGYALWGSGPRAPGGTRFVSYSAEARLARYFGSDPFAVAGFRPYVFVDAGYAMVDLRVSVRVRENLSRPAGQGGNDLEQTLEVWRRAGDALIAFGSGTNWVDDSGFALSGELRAAACFPFGAWLLTARLGTKLGF